MISGRNRGGGGRDGGAETAGGRSSGLPKEAHGHITADGLLAVLVLLVLRLLLGISDTLLLRERGHQRALLCLVLLQKGAGGGAAASAAAASASCAANPAEAHIGARGPAANAKVVLLMDLAVVLLLLLRGRRGAAGAWAAPVEK